jgi:hypothetical protein
MTTYNTIVIARAFSGDLFILDADDGVINVIDGCFLGDNGFKNEVKIPIEKGIYKCQCQVSGSSNGDDFSIEILNAERISYSILKEIPQSDNIAQSKEIPPGGECLESGIE